jgi:hypothetical protein
MIEREETVIRAVCDACRASLLDDVGGHRPNLNRGVLKSEFGYGSTPAALDPMGSSLVAKYDLCGKCFVKACDAVGLPAHDGEAGAGV